MIYRAPERATPTRSRAVTHELAALLVGMALLGAVILQFACAGAGGVAGRWLCVNNGRLAALQPPTVTPAATAGGQSSGIRPVGVATPAMPGVVPTPTVLGADTGLGLGFGSESGSSFPSATPVGQGPLDPSAPVLGGPTRDAQDPFGAADAISERRALMTAQAESFGQATASTPRRPNFEPQLPTEQATEPEASTTTTPTPGPGTPSVTPGPSPTGLGYPTETGYP
ncbi:MAG: hypothetical protein ABI780_00705 [Ardenticatenales bacterium]